MKQTTKLNKERLVLKNQALVLFLIRILPYQNPNTKNCLSSALLDMILGQNLLEIMGTVAFDNTSDSDPV